VLDTTWFDYTVGATVQFSLPVFNGQETKLKLLYTTPSQPFDDAGVESGSYPPERVRIARINAGEQGALWAFRGSDYRIEWKTIPGVGKLTAKVYDVTNGNVEVQSTKYDGSGPQKPNANGWCFVNKAARNPTDTLTTGAALLYICGGYVAMNYTGTNDTLGAMISEIHDGDVWTATGHKTNKTAGYYNVCDLVSKPGEEQTATPVESLEVKVVPNPYIVFDQWETSSDSRRIKFTHLPMTCTIRVFTLGGDLVKVLAHKDDPKHPLDNGGTEGWDLLNDNDQLIASGVYVYHVQSDVGEYTGKLVFIH